MTPQKDPFTVTLTFSEPVLDFEIPGSLKATLNTMTVALLSGEDGDAVYELRVTPRPSIDGSTPESIIIESDAVVDNAGNPNEDDFDSGEIVIDTIVPTVEISGEPEGEQNGVFPLTITFSEDVNGFAAAGLEVTGEATATTVSGGPKVYTATITPNANKEGDVTVQVKEDAVTDAAGNKSPLSAATPAIHIDTIAPTATISGLPSGEENDAFPLTITFLEDVTGFAPEDLEVTGEATATAVSGGPKVYTATITPNDNQEGDVTVQVRVNAVTDAAGNRNTVSDATPAIHIDTIAPTATISGLPTGEENDPFTLTITFNEDVSGFAAEDLTLTGPVIATVAPVGTSKMNYTATITPNATAEDDVTVQVKADAVLDDAQNSNPASAVTPAIHIDTIAPIVEITGIPMTPQNGPFTLTFTFSEDVTGFGTGSDFGIAGSIAINLGATSGGPQVYTRTFDPVGGRDGYVDISFSPNAVRDNAGNGSARAEIGRIDLDTIVPTVSVSGFPPATPEQNGPFPLTVMFSEKVYGFMVPDGLTLGLVDEPGVTSATPIATAALASGVEGDAVYTVTITPNATGAEGDVTVTVNAGAATDKATNPNTISLETDVVHVDTIAPTVTIEDVPEDEQNGAYDLTIQFSEPVNDFSVTDDLTVTLTPEPDVISATPIAAVTLKESIAGGAVYVVTVTPNVAGAEGDVSVTVNANTVQDFATNANLTGSNAASVHIDTIAPTVSVSGFPPVIPEQNGEFTLTVTFSEPVNGFSVTDDLTVTLTPEPGVPSATPIATAALALGDDGAAVYTVTITPNAAGAEGDVTVTVNANTVQDFALNANPAASPETDVVHVDTIIPTVSVSGFPPATPEQNGPFTLTVTFSEPVNGFAVPGDLTVGLAPEPGVTSASPIAEATLVSGENGEAVYEVTITPNTAGAEGNVTVTVNADRVQDFALNDNTASTGDGCGTYRHNPTDGLDGCYATGHGGCGDRLSDSRTKRSVYTDGDVLGTCERFCGARGSDDRRPWESRIDIGFCW